MCHIFFIHSSVDGHLGCFHVLAIVNSAAMNIAVHVSLWIMVFSGYMPSSGITGSYGSSNKCIHFYSLKLYQDIKHYQHLWTFSYASLILTPQTSEATVISITFFYTDYFCQFQVSCIIYSFVQVLYHYMLFFQTFHVVCIWECYFLWFNSILL